MPKEFYTEKDIEDLVRRGIHSLELNDQVFLTELAYEKAERLGMKLIKQGAGDSSVPVRPYISGQSSQNSSRTAAKPVTTPSTVMPAQHSQSTGDSELRKRIREAVMKRLGNQVDAALLDRIIERVLHSTGVK
jgi:restriction endonuclease Mrr